MIHAASMIVEYIRYRIEPAQAEAFVAAYETAAQSLRASSHCHGYELSRCTEAPEHFILRIEWESEQAHLEGFRRSEEFKPFLAAIRPYIPNIEEMRHYALTTVRAP